MRIHYILTLFIASFLASKCHSYISHFFRVCRVYFLDSYHEGNLGIDY